MANKKKGLGRGIDALFDVPDFEEEVRNNDERVELIDLTEIRPNPYQPRRHFDEDALNELAASIKVSGVLQPIILRKSSVKGYEIIAGERRFRASKLAGKDSIPAIVRELNEEVMMQVAILENLQREDLTSLEEAEAYNMMMDKLSMTQEMVAERLGKSRSYIANHLRLLSLPEEVKKLVQEGKLSNGQARTLLGLKDKSKIKKLARRAVKEKLTVRQLEHLVAEANQNPKTDGKKDNAPVKSVYIRKSEELLTDKFGTSVIIREKGDKGKIEIEYVSPDDLNRILEELNIDLN
ncbi:ParB/RepB/Spo0J family partition protein [Alkalibacterium pelagium]|jgi:ParB family chromosome partitioning protein|uniref:Chromosome partitioning protein, ParB family n=1 Tax=Alkalibacterium pelagium TaxID=426702 RepID=A0A1H7ILE7_9LACT|nr:ParB/RepB/Spo0J family partition protein [Alkalibacterium pelagium]GEN50128.1 chromosome partitioning protein ParB [Alkalibacterium pelagium]SEK63134.1 chromosome partitioning protein, ParB family [Alkalibacterium pelagium]